jgi:hypothetical protein
MGTRQGMAAARWSGVGGWRAARHGEATMGRGGVGSFIFFARERYRRGSIEPFRYADLSVTVYYTHPFRQVHRIIPGPNTVSYTYSYSDTYVYVCSHDCSVTVTVIHTYTYMYTVIHMYTYSYSDTYVQY